jgi:hypothetical protein
MWGLAQKANGFKSCLFGEKTIPQIVLVNQQKNAFFFLVRFLSTLKS